MFSVGVTFDKEYPIVYFQYTIQYSLSKGVAHFTLWPVFQKVSRQLTELTGEFRTRNSAINTQSTSHRNATRRSRATRQRIKQRQKLASWLVSPTDQLGDIFCKFVCFHYPAFSFTLCPMKRSCAFGNKLFLVLLFPHSSDSVAIHKLQYLQFNTKSVITG